MPEKVIHLVRKLLPFTASFIRNQINYYEKYQPSVVYTEKYKTPFYTQITTEFDTHFAFEKAEGKRIYDLFRILSPKAKKGIKEFIKDKNPDILHIHYGTDALVYSEIIKELGIPTVVSFYGYDCTSFPMWYLGYGKKLLQKKVFNNPAIREIFAMTPDMKNDLLNIGCPDDKIRVHYYGTETEPFYTEKPDHKNNGTVNFLIISGFHEKKGHGFLLDAFQKASEQMDRKIHLDIVGEGPLAKPIEEKISKLKLQNVTLHGKVDYGSVKHKQFLEKADVFVHPSVTPPNGDKEGSKNE